MPSTFPNGITMNNVPTPETGPALSNAIVKQCRVVDSIIDSSCVVNAQINGNITGTTSHIWQFGNVILSDAEVVQPSTFTLPSPFVGGENILETTDSVDSKIQFVKDELNSNITNNTYSPIKVDTALRVPEDYATLDAAISFLQDKGVAPGVSVTLDVVPSPVSPTTLSNIDMPGLTIRQRHPVNFESYMTASAISSVTGTNGNYTVTFTISDPDTITKFATVNVGDIIRIMTAGGSHPVRMLIGCYPIISKTSNSFAVKMMHNKDTFPNVAMLTGGVSFSRDAEADKSFGQFLISNCTLNALDNIHCIEFVMSYCKVNSLNGVHVNVPTPTTPGRVYGLSILQSSVGIAKLTCTNGEGIIVTSTDIKYATLSSSHNSGIGLKMFNSSIASSDWEYFPLNFFGNGGRGVQLEDSILTNEAPDSARAIAVRDNTATDIHASGRSFVKARYTTTTAAVFSPAVNTSGNGQSMIRTI